MTLLRLLRGLMQKVWTTTRQRETAEMVRLSAQGRFNARGER
jgi:hypothetical protein